MWESCNVRFIREKKKLFTNTSDNILHVKIMTDRCYLIWDEDEMLSFRFFQRRFKNGCFMHHIPLKRYIFFHYIQYYAHTLQEIQNSLGKSKLSTSCWQCDKLSPFFFSVWTPFSSLRPILCRSQSTYTCVEKSWCNLVPALESYKCCSRDSDNS